MEWVAFHNFPESIMISKKAQEIPPFIVMDVLEKAQELERAGESVIHLEVGEPDFDTPECIKEAAFRAICDGKTHYTHSLGLIDLREAICEDYWKRYRVKVSPDQILIASGTSPAMLLLFSALLDPGDEIILSNPYYPCYPNIIRYRRRVSGFCRGQGRRGFPVSSGDDRREAGPEGQGHHDQFPFQSHRECDVKGEDGTDCAVFSFHHL